MQQIYQQPDMNDFSARPKIVNKKGKYREEQEEGKKTQNLMYDKRVIRGNTYASITLSKSSDPLLVEKHQNRLNEKQAVINKGNKQVNEKMQSTLPVQNQMMARDEIGIQTVEYVEMLSDRLQEKDIEIQTDFYLDRPSNNRFRVKMEGTCVETQIEKGDIFDFEEEVEPILGMLCMKVIEQSRMEVLEEQELQVMKSQMKEFEQKVRAQRQEMQRLAEIERRSSEENIRRTTQHRLCIANQKETQKKILDRVSAKSLIGLLVSRQVDVLEKTGLFNSQQTMINEYHEWLLEQTRDRHEMNIEEIRQFNNQQRYVQNGLEKRNRQAMDDRQKLKDEADVIKIERQIQKAYDKEEREKAKQKQIRIQQREVFKLSVETYLKKAESKKDNVLGQIFTDVSFAGNDQPVIGMLGTVLAETVFTMGVLQSLLVGEGTEILAVMQGAYKENAKVYLEYLDVFLDTVFMKDASVILPVGMQIDEELQKALDNQNVNIDNLNEHLTAETLPVVVKVIQNNICSIGYQQIVIDNCASLDADFISQVLEVTFSALIKQEHLQSQKIKLHKTAAQSQYPEEFALKLSPLEDELNASTQGNDNSQSILMFDDKVTLCPHELEGNPLLVYQYIPTIIFRKQLIKSIVNKIAKKFAVTKIEKYLLPLINRKSHRLFEEIVQKHSVKDPKEQLENPFFMEFELQ